MNKLVVAIAILAVAALILSISKGGLHIRESDPLAPAASAR